MLYHKMIYLKSDLSKEDSVFPDDLPCVLSVGIATFFKYSKKVYRCIYEATFDHKLDIPIQF